MYTLGLSLSHEAGAVITHQGLVLAAASEERFTRKKNQAGFPQLAIESCLRVAKIDPSQISAVVFGELTNAGVPEGVYETNIHNNYNALAKIRDLLAKAGVLKTLMASKLFVDSVNFILSQPWLRQDRQLRARLRNLGLKKFSLEFLDHHLCHNASAYYTSGLDNCLAVSLDAYGDGYCSKVYACEGGRLRLIKSTPSMHSPGNYYSFVTGILGFKPGRHEGKITGLAALGKSSGAKQVFESRINYQKGNFVCHGELGTKEFAILKEKLTSYEPKMVAFAVQEHLEELVCRHITDLKTQTGFDQIVLSGGVFGNVKLNQRIANLGFKKFFVFPHMGDGGLAAGAALLHDHRLVSLKPQAINHVYWGEDYSDATIAGLLSTTSFAHHKSDNIEAEIAKLIHQGKVVARFNGRMEFGPRALCNRSILCRADDPAINKWLNDRLLRTEFMPFAPVILEEDAPRYLKGFDPNNSIAAKFMTTTYDVTDHCRSVAPAVVHVDNTARPQIVSKEDNLSAYKILSSYKALCGESILINTSFNMHEEPIVGTPEDAIRSFAQGKLDVLAIGSYIVTL